MRICFPIVIFAIVESSAPFLRSVATYVSHLTPLITSGIRPTGARARSSFAESLSIGAKKEALGTLRLLETATTTFA